MLFTPLPSPSDTVTGFPDHPVHRILVVGGSYGGLSCVLSLLDLLDGKPAKSTVHHIPDFGGRKPHGSIKILLLDERDGYFHTVGAPLAHTSQRHVEPFWKSYSSLPELQHPSLRILQGRLSHLDTSNLIARYETSSSDQSQQVVYDHLVLATGLSRRWPIVPSSHSRSGYVADSTALIAKVSSSDHVVVIGGGAVGIELAGELKHYHPTVKVTLIHSRQELLSNEPLPAEFKSKALELLREEGVDVVLGQRAKQLSCDEPASVPTGEHLELSDGTIITAAVIYNATAHCPPNTRSVPVQALDQSGFVRVSPTLMFPSEMPNHQRHYAVGDVAAVKGIKRAGAALVMGRTVAANIWAQIITESTKEAFEFGKYPEVAPMMCLAIGEQGVGFSGADVVGADGKVTGGTVTFGVAVREKMFSDDLGWAACLRFMGFA